MITFQQQLWTDIVDELKPILPIHYKELAMDQDDIPLDPDYDLYTKMESIGILHVCTAREDGVLIGYFLTNVMPHPHYKSSLHGKVDIYYVHPDHRGNGVGYKLFMFHEQEMKRLGVIKVVNACKLHQDHEPLFKSLGYNQIERVFSKILKD